MKSPLTTLCYIEKDGCYLMLHRVTKKNDINHDKWIGVGGHFEEGKSPEDCLFREVKEEKGLTIDSFRFRGIVTFISDDDPAEYMHLFTTDSFHGQIIDLCAFGAEASSGCEKNCFFLLELQHIADIITRKFDFPGKTRW